MEVLVREGVGRQGEGALALPIVLHTLGVTEVTASKADQIDPICHRHPQLPFEG